MARSTFFAGKQLLYNPSKRIIKYGGLGNFANWYEGEQMSKREFKVNDMVYLDESFPMYGDRSYYGRIVEYDEGRGVYIIETEYGIRKTAFPYQLSKA